MLMVCYTLSRSSAQTQHWLAGKRQRLCGKGCAGGPPKAAYYGKAQKGAQQRRRGKTAERKRVMLMGLLEITKERACSCERLFTKINKIQHTALHT